MKSLSELSVNRTGPCVGCFGSHDAASMSSCDSVSYPGGEPLIFQTYLHGWWYVVRYIGLTVGHGAGGECASSVTHGS